MTDDGSCFAGDKQLTDSSRCFTGDTESSKSALKSQIVNLNGTVVSKLDASVSIVISSKREVEKMNKKMKEARDLDIPVLSEGFIAACRESKPAEIYESYKLSTYWGRSLDDRFSSVASSAKSHSSLKSAAVRAAEARAGTLSSTDVYYYCC